MPVKRKLNRNVTKVPRNVKINSKSSKRSSQKKRVRKMSRRQRGGGKAEYKHRRGCTSPIGGDFAAMSGMPPTGWNCCKCKNNDHGNSTGEYRVKKYLGNNYCRTVYQTGAVKMVSDCEAIDSQKPKLNED